MSTPERRHIPRTTMEKLAYIHIEPNNGGIVLNVSGQGLCFHAIAPVEKSGRFRFSLLEQNRRIAACGELAWTDEIHKIGGVRFTTLTTDAREQIQDWISQPTAPLEEHKSSTLGAVLLKAFPSFRVRRSETKSRFDFSSAFAALVLQLRTRMRLNLSGFSGGLATGLLLSALSGSIFLLVAHRRDIGESLIHLGERLAGERLSGETVPGERLAEARPHTASPTPPVSPVKEVVSQGTVQTAARTQEVPQLPVPAHVEAKTTPRVQGSVLAKNAAAAHGPVEASKSVAAHTSASPERPKQLTSQPPVSTVKASRVPETSVPQRPSVVATAAPSPPVPSPSLLLSPASNSVPNKPQPPVETANADPVRAPSQETIFSPSQMYFDLGKSKNELWAQDLSDKLAKLGLPASVVQKGHLWMNSYQVLVGPYNKEEEATKVDKDLVSRGYKPKPFERGSRSFLFGSGVTLNGTKLPVGNFTISWESYVTDAKVKFTQNNDVLVAADARWIKQSVRYPHNEYVYIKNTNGSRVLIEIHFAGLDRALLIRNSS